MPYQGAIFDVDGVLVDSPHELAWREALKELMEGDWHDIRDQTSWTAERFTTQVYQQVMAGKPRLAGARAALEYFGVPDVDRRIEQYAAAKQEHVVQLIEQGRFMAFPDALRFILAVKDSGFRVAAASSSKNAKLFLERIRLDTFAAEQRLDYGFVHDGMTLEELFDADISGRDFPRGKPDPMIFLTAAEELGLSPEVCFVVEDATSGVQAAKAGGMAAIGVARLGDEQQLADAGADLVVTTLDDISLPTLIEGRLGGTAGRRGDPTAIHRAATGRMDPGIRRLRPRTSRAAGGAVCAGQRLLRYSWRAARGESRRCQLPGPPTWPAFTTGWSAKSQAVRWRTRTWSTSPTGYHCNFASPVVHGSTCSSPASKIIALNSTCNMERSSAVLPGKTPMGEGPGWCSAGS